MTLTANELLQLIKQKGEPVLAKTTEDYDGVPKGTMLWFGDEGESLSTYDYFIDNKNREFGYDFKYEWSIWNSNNGYGYKGKFEVEENKFAEIKQKA